MIVFKMFKGFEADLPTSIHEGYAYFTIDTGKFFIDISNEERIQINAKYAESLSDGEHTVEISDILEEINKVKPSIFNLQLMLDSTVWVGTQPPYTLEVAANGVIENESLQNIDVAPTPTIDNIKNISKYTVLCTRQGHNMLTFTAFDIKPTENLLFNVEVTNLQG